VPEFRSVIAGNELSFTNAPLLPKLIILLEQMQYLGFMTLCSQS